MKKTVLHSILLILIGATSLFLVGCEKSRLIHSWTAPDAAGYHFNKPLAVAVIDNDQLRSTAEEAIVRNIINVQAYPSYIVLREGELDDIESTKKRLSRDGYDGAIVLRLVNLEDKVNYVQAALPAPYYDYWTYYNWAWARTAYSPVYVQKERIVQIETTLFSIEDDKLLWIGVSESKNPESVSSLIDEIASVIGKELRKKGIVP